MAIQPDSAVYDREGQLALFVEVKAVTGRDLRWAVEMRHNLIAHGFAPAAPYFLLALPDQFYLWLPARPLEAQPDYVIEAMPMLSSYFAGANVTPETISGLGFELIVLSWLNDLTYSDMDALHPEEKQGWLTDASLLSILKHGRVVLPDTLQV